MKLQLLADVSEGLGHKLGSLIVKGDRISSRGVNASAVNSVAHFYASLVKVVMLHMPSDKSQHRIYRRLPPVPVCTM